MSALARETVPEFAASAADADAASAVCADAGPLYVYLCSGRSPAAERELAYSVETLLAEIGDPARVLVYAERPKAFARLPATVIEAAALFRETFRHPYRHRVKMVVLADALRRSGRACVLLDGDTFIRPGFAHAVTRALASGAAMNQFVRREAYPDFKRFETELPHLGRYRLDPANSAMLNSGLIAASAAHLPLIEDALFLSDALWAGGLTRHDIEQFAVAEALRRGGVSIALIDDVIVHYCPRWSRRYMRRRLRRRRAGKVVPFGKARVRLFKAYWSCRLALRRAWRKRKGSR